MCHFKITDGGEYHKTNNIVFPFVRLITGLKQTFFDMVLKQILTFKQVRIQPYLDKQLIYNL
jgi:hypothetical protein